jgi:excisionase family DNA binding protein
MRQKQSDKSATKNLSQSSKGLRASFNSDSANEKGGLPQWVRASYSALTNTADKSRPRNKKAAEKALTASQEQLPRLLTVSEAAACLSVSQKTIRRMIEAGNLAVIRLGRSVRIHPEVIEKIMRHNE